MMLVNLDVVPVTVHMNLGKGGATLVAYPMSEDGKVTHVVDARQVLISTAQCSQNDFYCKKTGRDIAMSRAADEGFILRFPNKANKELKLAMLRQLAGIYAGMLTIY